MPHVVSSLSSTQEYISYQKMESQGQNDTRPAVVEHSVRVRGGAHVQGVTHTPEGVLTPISEEDAAFLEAHPTFMDHKTRGFVKIIGQAADADEVARADLAKRDDSSQLSAAHGDFEVGGRAGGLAPTDVAPLI